MAITIAVANQKGGVAKTTTTINIGAILAESGKSVLLVDMDPQGNLTISCGIKAGEKVKNLYHALVNNIDLEDVIQPFREKLDVVPSNIFLAGAESQLYDEIGKEQILTQILKDVETKYDYILIDCPPVLSFLTISAFVASNYVLVPMACDYLAILGTGQLLETVAKVKKRLNPDIKILGVAPTRFVKTTSHSREALDYLKKILEGKVKVFETIINETTRLKDSISNAQPIIEFAPKHQAAKEYRSLTKEVYEQIKA